MNKRGTLPKHPISKNWVCCGFTGRKFPQMAKNHIFCNRQDVKFGGSGRQRVRCTRCVVCCAYLGGYGALRGKEIGEKICFFLICGGNHSIHFQLRQWRFFCRNLTELFSHSPPVIAATRQVTQPVTLFFFFLVFFRSVSKSLRTAAFNIRCFFSAKASVMQTSSNIWILVV